MTLLTEGVKEGLRIFWQGLQPYKSYSGNWREICKKIVNECWNGKYFQVSNGNFSEFYVRDFAFCHDSLKKLRYGAETGKTLNYCLEKFSRFGKITTTITKQGVPIDVFGIAPDSLALLVKCLDKNLTKDYREFLNQQINYYYKIIFDEETGLVRKNTYFSSAKDHCTRNSSMYDNCMVAFLSKNLTGLGLENPFKYNFNKVLKENFWTGNYFKDDLDSGISSDANIYPYWLGLFDSKKMIKRSVEAIQNEGLDKPFPIKYTNSRKGKFLFPMKIFVPNYEGNTVWAHHGLNFIKVVERIDREKARFYKQQYAGLIKKHKNFLEVYEPDGTPYKTRFYKADSGLLWCANLLC